MAKTRRTNKSSGSVKQLEALPVGSLVNSMLTLVQFQAQMGANWELADGGVVAGSEYNTLTGSSFKPDCRGTFLRGLDNGKGLDVGRVLGTSQVDATAPNGLNSTTTSTGDHGHTYDRAAPTGFVAASGSSWGIVTIAPGTSVNGPGAHGHSISVSSSDSETRPINIAVNIFVKINDN